MKIEWHHYNNESDFFMDGERLDSSRLYQYFHQPLVSSIHSVINVFQEIVNGSSFTIEFHGESADYIMLKEVMDSRNSSEPISIEWVSPAKKLVAYDEIIHYLKELIDTSPIESWKNEKLQAAIDKLDDLLASFYIVGTKNTGKSTLLNAMLGHELLPATPATSTTKVINVMQTIETDYVGEAYDENYEIISSIESITKKDIEMWDKDIDVEEITIEWPILHNREKVEVRLTKVPAPRSSKDVRHLQEVDWAIENEDYPIFLYVMDATKIGTNEEKIYLNTFIEQIEEGLDIEENVYFILNKVDELKNQAALERAIKKANGFLAKYNIHRPKLFMLSAKYALWYRQQQNQVLSLAQQEELQIMTNKFKGFQFLKHTTLSREMYEDWCEKLEILPKSQGGEIRTGLPVLQEALFPFAKNKLFTTQMKKIIVVLAQIGKKEINGLKKHYALEEEKQQIKEREALEQVKGRYSLLVEKKIEEHVGTLYLPVFSVFSLVESIWMTPEELLNELKENEGEIRHFAALISELESENVPEEEEDFYELLYAQCFEFKSAIEKALSSTNYEQLLYDFDNDQLFYSEQQYEYIVAYTIALLRKCEETCLNISQLEGPLRHLFSTQAQLIHSIINKIENIGENMTLVTVDKADNESSVFIKQMVDMHFTSIKDWLTSQLDYWITNSLVSDSTIERYTDYYYGSEIEVAFEPKRNQLEENYRVVYEQQTLALERYYKSIEGLVKLKKMLQEGDML